jgi:hypothetical protein
MAQRLLKRAAFREAYELVIEDLTKGNFVFRTEHVPTGCDQNKAVFRKRKDLELFGRVDWFGDDTDIGEAFGDRTYDLSALALFEVDVDIGMGRQENGQKRWKKFYCCDGIRKNVDMTSQPFCEIVQLAAHFLQMLHHDARMALKRRSRWGDLDAPPLSLKQRNAERVFHGVDPLARRRQSHVHATRSMRDASGLRDMQE